MKEVALEYLNRVALDPLAGASVRRDAYTTLLGFASRNEEHWQRYMRDRLVDEEAFLIEKHDGIQIVRDDIIAGGSKRRFLRPLIASEGKEWVYSSPRTGYGQIALAYVCRDLHKKATVIVAKAGALHPYTLEAKAAGATVIEVEHGYRSHTDKVAKDYVEQHEGSVLAPFGFHHELVLNEIARLAAKIKAPKEVWSIVSSGTLTSGLQRAWPKAKFFGVFVGHEPTDAERGKAELFKAPEKFASVAKTLPPFPSCETYDAKAWQFVTAKASKGALFWNVGR